jgi:hypothetical protein
MFDSFLDLFIYIAPWLGLMEVKVDLHIFTIQAITLTSVCIIYNVARSELLIEPKFEQILRSTGIQTVRFCPEDSSHGLGSTDFSPRLMARKSFSYIHILHISDHPSDAYGVHDPYGFNCQSIDAYPSIM